MPVQIWSVGGGGKGYSIMPCRNLVLTPGDGKVTITWTDPEDLLWKGTKVVRKEGSYPTSIKDGVLVVDSTVKNQFALTCFEDVGLINNVEYFYSVFAYSKSSFAIPVTASATPMSFSKVLKENSWSDISKASEMGIASTLWNVGDEINVQIAGGTYTFQIYGFNHDDKSDGSGKAGITFGMKKLLNEQIIASNQYSNTNYIEWSTCYMKQVTIPHYYETLQSDIKKVIKTVNKVTGNYSTQTIKQEQEALFLFAAKEVGLTRYSSTTEQGYLTTYPIFTNNASRIKKIKTTAYEWWLRSPMYGSFLTVTSTGTESSCGADPDSSRGVCLGFCV